MTNLSALLENSVEKFADRTAIVFGSTQLTYAQVDGAANQVANLLVEQGVEPGDKVALSCPNLPYFTIGGVVFAAGARTWFDQPFAAEWLPAYLPWFLAGTALAACSVDPGMRARLDAAARDLAGWWLLALGLFVAACTPITGPTGLVDAPTPVESALKCVLYGAVAVCVIFPLVFGPELEGPVRRWLASPVPSALGEISYGVFSIHMFVLLMGMELLGFGTFNDRFWTVLGMTIAVTIPIAALSYVLFERRMMRLRGWRPSGRRRKRRPEPESASELGATEAAAATSTSATSESA